MTKVQKFTVETFNIKNNNTIIEVWCCMDKYECPIFIPKDKFEFFLKINDRLNWELNYSDHTGGHCQKTGTMSIAEYWDTADKYIHQDLYDYMVNNPIVYRGIVYKNAIESMLVSIENKKVKKLAHA